MCMTGEATAIEVAPEEVGEALLEVRLCVPEAGQRGAPSHRPRRAVGLPTLLSEITIFSEKRSRRRVCRTSTHS